jgi:two-component system, OmpR family, response regulator NblR
MLPNPTTSVTPIVLTVIPDAALASIVDRDLIVAGYAPVSSSNIEDAWEYLAVSTPALVAIDRSLPNDGASWLTRQARDRGMAMPILWLMPTAELADRVACMASGADDYFLKPYYPEGLLPLIRLYLHQSPQLDEQLHFGELVLDLSRRQVLRGNRKVELTAKEFDLLKFFMSHPNETLKREKILENVWGADYMGESNVIEVYIRYLRLKLHGDGERTLIHTVRGVGYVLREG